VSIELVLRRQGMPQVTATQKLVQQGV